MLTPTDHQDLKNAILILENPSFAIKLTNYVGMPIESIMKYLPNNYQVKLNDGITTALQTALSVATASLSDDTRESNHGWHQFLVGTSGAIGGAFGLWGVAVELPISTTLIMRSILATACSHGENIQNPQSQLACLEVFALGSPQTDVDDGSESGYLAIRIALAKAITEASEYLVVKGGAEASAPVIIRLITQIAARFGIVVSEKAAVQAVPVIGAATGAIINTVFINHFQNMAEGHFTVRRLERRYGTNFIQSQYKALRATLL
ncbi:EcsC family protein [Beggiatoa leptomitoformis]|uniref:EcsC family protein n=1 Tax=Beggiatoa leptomitoformis TaxID=288004 RepID=A0A2N9YCR0_9GAMM|nr:EcsC family protein [Beggiatoa leptomitoformis]AUI68258.1 EcsC family protein [Beggiatoa leptomitoformis]QGX03430.1 EcsC family protein [Beggiatoa leptomitoformis]